MEHTVDILNTARLASIWHRKQKRAGKGKDRMPYIIHPLEVGSLIAQAGGTPETVCGGLLHDVKEDCGIVDALILGIYPDRTFGRTVLEIVDEVTDIKGMPYDDGKARQIRLMVSGYSPEAKLLKLADETSNMRSLVNHPPQWSTDFSDERKYIIQMREVVEADTERNTLLDLLFWMAYDEAKRFYHLP